MAHAWVQVEKNVVNHGTWQTENTEFTGTSDKHISQSEGHPYGGTLFTSENSGSKIYLDSDVEFTVPTFHLNNTTLTCGDHILKANTSFYDGTIHSDAEIKGNCDFWNTTFTGNIVLSGNHRFSNPIMNGVIDNTGVMQDITFYGGFFNSNNHLINRNSIQSLQLKIFGDLTNYGTIDNNSTVKIVGSITQHISLLQSIESPTTFYSDISGAAYQWIKDGADLLNQTSENLFFNSLQLTDAGVYKCRVVTSTGETKYSRDIIVNNVTSLEDNEFVCDFQVFPNPVTDHTTIKWNQKLTSSLKIELLNAEGKLITTYTNSNYQPGRHEIEIIISRDLKPSQYYIRLRGASFSKTVKLFCIR